MDGYLIKSKYFQLSVFFCLMLLSLTEAHSNISKMKKPSYFILFFLTTTFFSCIDNSLPDLSECIASGSLEKSELEIKLLGTWEWQFTVCCPESTDGMLKNSIENAGTKITFYDDGTGMKEEKSDTTDFSWTLKTTDFNYYGIETDPTVFLTSGRLFICGDQLLANDSYRDGADKYFKKIKDGYIKPK